MTYHNTTEAIGAILREYEDMGSPTLEMIMKHWCKPLDDEVGWIDLPFNVEAFCAEMDERIETLRSEAGLDLYDDLG